VSWDTTKPWTAPTRSVVLFQADTEWRFAIHNDAGILDGALRDVPATATPDEAQASRVTKVVTDTGLEYEVKWSADKPDWWSAELTVRTPASE
jgi:hypothetical protein